MLGWFIHSKTIHSCSIYLHVHPVSLYLWLKVLGRRLVVSNVRVLRFERFVKSNMDSKIIGL